MAKYWQFDKTGDTPNGIVGSVARQAYQAGLLFTSERLRVGGSPARSVEARFNRDLVIGKIASDLCRKLNVEDRRGWYWNSFIEILEAALPGSLPTQLEPQKWKHLENDPDVPQTPHEGEMPR